MDILSSNGLEHTEVTILEIIIDNKGIEYQEVLSRVNDMMSLLGEPMDENTFFNRMENLVNLNLVTQVNSDPIQYSVTETGVIKLYGDI